MKKIVVSSALSALLVLPAAAFEIYNADDKKLDLYGSIRGFVGMGENSHDNGVANFLFGVQTNSNFGLKFQADKFNAQIEIGAVESDASLPAMSPLRLFWGSYNTGVGTILIGKAQTPTADTAFSSDYFWNDSGSVGFGGTATASRKLQAQYNIAGLSLALINDYIATGYGGNPGLASNGMPRVALSYTIGNAQSPLLKIAGTYKHYERSEAISYNAGTPTLASTPKDAWHIFVGTKPTFGNAWLSVLAHYGKNGHFYGEQATSSNNASWAHSSVDVGNNGIATGDIKRTGGKIEFGTALSKELTFIVGAGYQETFGEDVVGKWKNYTAFVQLPYKVSANWTLSPQVGWYQVDNVSTATKNTTPSTIASVNGAVRVKWDF